MADQGITLEAREGVVYLTGVMDEVADLLSLLNQPEPLKLNFKGVTRFNSSGVRNLLLFLSRWGSKKLEYHDCPCELIDQFNMIPALLGSSRHNYQIKSLYVPYECRSCPHDEEVLEELAPIEADLRQGRGLPTKVCPECSSTLNVISEVFFVFLER